MNSTWLDHLSKTAFLSTLMYAIVRRPLGGIDQICSHSRFIIKTLWGNSRNLLGCLLRSNSAYTQLDKDVDAEKWVSRSVASVLNAAGARLWYSMSALSSSKLAGQFMEVLKDETGSMKAEKALYCAWHQQDELRNFQHHQKSFGFRFSQDSCPGEAQLVVSLFQALLSKLSPGGMFMHLARDPLAIEHKVGNLTPQCIACLICFLQGA
jgi:hypothetical protein